MRPRNSWGAEAFVMLCALGNSAGLMIITGMLLAALACSAATTITLPLIATFNGSLDATGSHTMTVTGSWITAGP